MSECDREEKWFGKVQISALREVGERLTCKGAAEKAGIVGDVLRPAPNTCCPGDCDRPNAGAPPKGAGELFWGGAKGPPRFWLPPPHAKSASKAACIAGLCV